VFHGSGNIIISLSSFVFYSVTICSFGNTFCIPGHGSLCRLYVFSFVPQERWRRGVMKSRETSGGG